MSDEFTISEGPARYQVEEILSSDFRNVNDAYRNYFIQSHGGSLAVGFNMYGDKEKHERPHLCHKYDISNMEKIVKSAGIPSISFKQNFPGANAESGFLTELEWKEYPGHEEFAHDLYELRETIRKVDRYLQDVEDAGDRIADELARE